MIELKVVEDSPKLIRVVLAGELDSLGAGQVELKLTVLMRGTSPHAIVDMSNVTYIASMGVGLLVSVLKVLNRRGARLILLNPQPAVLIVLEATRLTEILGVAMDEAAAQTLLMKST